MNAICRAVFERVGHAEAIHRAICKVMIFTYLRLLSLKATVFRVYTVTASHVIAVTNGPGGDSVVDWQGPL